MRMAIAKFGPHEIPRIYTFDERLIDLAQTKRTVGGTERRDAVDVKRSWDVGTRPIAVEIITNLEQHLRTILWGYDTWWIDDFGDETNVVVARIDAGTWVKGRVLGRPDLQTLSFTVIER